MGSAVNDAEIQRISSRRIWLQAALSDAAIDAVCGFP
jgi:hypothetical protein